MATRTISTKLAVEGEAQYRQAISACNSELKTLKSDLALVESEFRNNANSMEALTAKGTALESMYQKQQEKISTLEDALKNAQRAQEGYASRVSAAQENIDRCEKALEKLRGSTEDTSEEQAELTAELEKWTKELDEAQAGQAAAEQGVQRWQKQLSSARVELNGLSDEITENYRYLDEARESADGCAHSMDEFGNAVDKSGDAIQQLAAALAAAGVAVAVKEIADALRECVDTFASFESQMSTVAAISGTSGDELTALADKAKYMGATTAFTAAQAAEAFEYMAMAGWKTNDMINGLEGIMYLAAASGETLASTSDIVTDALTAFGLSASDSSHFADVLAAASSNANTNVGMMGETFKYAAPVAGALGYSVEDTALAIGLMANAGIKGSQAGTALRSMLSNLAKPSKTVAAYMEKLGVSLTDSAGNMRSLSDLMAILRDRFSELSEAQQAEYASGLAGKEAMSGLLAIVNAADADFQKLTSAINECNGAAYDMSQIQLDNYAGKVTLLESAIDGLKLAVGEQLTPALGGLAEMGTGAFNWATDFVEEHPWIVNAITGVTVALGALAAGVTALSVGPKIIEALNAALGSLSAHPLILVTSAIAGLVAAVGSFGASIDKAENETKQLIEAIKETKQAYDDLMASMGEQQASVASLAGALKDLLAVEGKSTAQKESIEQIIGQLNEAVPDLALAYDREKDALVGLTEAELDAALSRAKAQEEYQAQMARLTELYVEHTEIETQLEEANIAFAEAQQGLNEALEAGNTDVIELEDQYFRMQNAILALTPALEENEAQIAELERATGGYSETQGAAAEKVKTMAAATDELIGRMNSLQEEYDKSYAEAMKSIDGQLGLFKKLDGEAKTSIDDLIDTLKGQVEYMDTYAANIQKAMELGVDEGLIKKLSDGSEESAQILAAIVKDGGKNVDALNEQFAKVEEGKENFATTVAEMELDFSEKMGQMVEDLNQAIEEMDAAEEAYRIGQNNIQGLLDGAASIQHALVAQYRQMGRDALAAYQAEMDQHSPSKKMMKAGQYDIQGLIKGAEAETPKLADTYAAGAKAALESYERQAAKIADIRFSPPDSKAFTDAYEAAAQTVADKMAMHLPVTMNIPQPAETLGAQMQAMSAATINAISGLAQSGGSRREVVRLVTVDGKELASAVFDDLADYGDANGTPILNPKR